MTLKTYASAKDWVLTSLLVFVGGVALDIRSTVKDDHDRRIVIEKDVEVIKQNANEEKSKREQKDEQHDAEFVKVWAVINRAGVEIEENKQTVKRK